MQEKTPQRPFVSSFDWAAPTSHDRCDPAVLLTVPNHCHLLRSSESFVGFYFQCVYVFNQSVSVGLC